MLVNMKSKNRAKMPLHLYMHGEGVVTLPHVWHVFRSMFPCPLACRRSSPRQTRSWGLLEPARILARSLQGYGRPHRHMVAMERQAL